MVVMCGAICPPSFLAQSPRSLVSLDTHSHTISLLYAYLHCIACPGLEQPGRFVTNLLLSGFFLVFRGTAGGELHRTWASHYENIC